MLKMIIKAKTSLTNITTRILLAKIKIKPMKNRSQQNSAASRKSTENINIASKKGISQSMITRPTSPNKLTASITNMNIKDKIMIHISNHLTTSQLIKYRIMPMIRTNSIKRIQSMLNMRK